MDLQRAVLQQKPHDLVSRYIFEYQNLNGILSKSVSVEALCASENVTALTATWDREEYANKVFAVLRSFNVSCTYPHGGVALIVKKYFKDFGRRDLEHDAPELLLVEIFALKLIVEVFCGPTCKFSNLIPILIEHWCEKFSTDLLERTVLLGALTCPLLTGIRQHPLQGTVGFFWQRLKNFILNRSYPARRAWQTFFILLFCQAK